jgi:protein transport protein SEC24
MHWVSIQMLLQSQLGGKLLVFQSTLPSLGVGRLKLRGDDPRIYGTEKEYLLRGSEEQFYKHMAADFSKYQIGVNIYAFSDRYTDLASLGEAPFRGPTFTSMFCGNVEGLSCFLMLLLML